MTPDKDALRAAAKAVIDTTTDRSPDGHGLWQVAPGQGQAFVAAIAALRAALAAAEAAPPDCTDVLNEVLEAANGAYDRGVAAGRAAEAASLDRFDRAMYAAGITKREREAVLRAYAAEAGE